ncbi:DNA-binding CsgD family transcriptional regulator [Streptomyces aurantiacus]|uniref:helix-turn-helix transcriptional regulator n=1 Tax=Streptomyces aurantiacus TaxID=47760 RepID=UPI0027941A4F|nr:helix-turn-helix transcriptional regulator [Streptomyces aurantiacus]MDQ0776209.1 DNA-binding CsgD family transcriptional regulator [Streptomyces aurantiacus]
MKHPHSSHSVEELCAPGAELYARALREGRVRGTDAEEAPCLVDFGMLQPTVEDLSVLEPVAPVVALHRLLRTSGERVADERRREARLAEAFEPLMRIDGRQSAPTDTPAIRILSGTGRINQAITEAMGDATREVLSIQTNAGHTGDRHPVSEVVALARDQALLDRGGRIRVLYQHTLRHSLTVRSRYEQLRGDVEARSLDELTDRLFAIDGVVAFLPANKDGTLALEVRHPALVGYFVKTFERFWRLATPMYPDAEQRPSLNGVTPRQQAIASLLVEGHTDAAIAERLGLNVRTARVHIAKLATLLGSRSRAQLGYLIGRSGILDDQER